MTTLGPILILALAAVAALAGLIGGPVAVYGVVVGILIAGVPCWIPYQAIRRGEEHGIPWLKATTIRFVSALAVAGIAEFTQPKDVAKTFLLGMAGSYLVLLTVETIYFSKQFVGKISQSARQASSATDQAVVMTDKGTSQATPQQG